MRLANGIHLVFWITGQFMCDMQKLTGEILMDKNNIHATTSSNSLYNTQQVDPLLNAYQKKSHLKQVAFLKHEAGNQT
jgi:hypothetical protein